MSVARRIHCAPIVTRTHIPCTSPDFLRDVPDCSVQHFTNKKASIFRQKESWATPALFASVFRLPPVAIDQNPPVSTVLPAMCDPDTAAMRWAHPMAMNPDVAVTVPAVVAIDPHPSRVRWMFVDLDDGCRWRNADDDLRHRDRRSETQGKQPCQKSLFHRNRTSMGMNLPESGNLFLAVILYNPRAGNWLRATEKAPPERFPFR